MSFFTQDNFPFIAATINGVWIGQSPAQSTQNTSKAYNVRD